MRTRLTWLAMVSVALFFTVSVSAWERNYSYIAEIFFVLGIVLVGVGAFGRLWCSVYIGGYKHGTLITSGPYSICRNPLYFFSFVASLGVGFASETLTIPAIIGAAFALYYPFVIRREEEALRRVHGSEYASYLKTVPRFFPKASLYSEPETYVMRPAIFRKHLASAIWFVWIPAAAEFVEMLHEIRVIPGIFSIY